MRVVALIIFITLSLNAEYYKVNVKRESSDLYKVLYPNILIQTKYCYEYAYGDDAILKYTENAYDNELIFSSGTKCIVSKVFEMGKTTSVHNKNSQYLIDIAINDETFFINGKKFKAKLYCLGWDKGNKVVFVKGSSLGACVSATLFNVNLNQSCEVWCE